MCESVKEACENGRVRAVGRRVSAIRRVTVELYKESEISSDKMKRTFNVRLTSEFCCWPFNIYSKSVCRRKCLVGHTTHI